MQRIRATRAQVAATEAADVLRGEDIEVRQGRAPLPQRVPSPSRGCGGCGASGAGRRLASRIPPIEGLAEVLYLTKESVFELTDATDLGLEVAGVRTDQRGYVVTDDHQQDQCARRVCRR